MRRRLCICAILAAAIPATELRADEAVQPPMNALDYAYYDCENAAFEIDYDSETPTQATIITSGKTRYELTRTPSDTGVKFAKGNVSFWTDGKSVRVTGTEPRMENCRRKPV